MARPIAAAVRPYHGRRRALLRARATITPGAMNGSSSTGNGRGDPTGPNHHVAMPSSRLAFHTPLQATNTRTHVAAVTIRQPNVSWPGHRRTRRRGRRRGAVVVSTGCDGTAAGGRTGSRRYPPGA